MKSKKDRHQNGVKKMNNLAAWSILIGVIIGFIGTWSIVAQLFIGLSIHMPWMPKTVASLMFHG